jgi:ribosomal protein S4
MYKAASFLRPNNLQFVIKKKLNLKRQKTFFYSVHIAAPRKKNKKWSLFGLKNIYYKKISLFFGFKKIVDFLKVYNISNKVFGGNSYSIFLMLEGRLENFLLRLNIFPSIYFIKKFIQYGNVFVNNKTINYCSFSLNFNEIVSLNKKYHKYFYFLLKSRLRSKKILLNYPSFMEVDYKLFTAMLIRSPTTESLTFPVSFDIYTKFLTVNR